MKRLWIIAALLACSARAQDADVWWGALAGSQPVFTDWWDGLNMSSVWPLTSDAADVVGNIDGTWQGTELYGATNGLDAAYLNGASSVVFGDEYDINANETLAYGGWFWLPLTGHGADSVIIGKGEPFTGTLGGYYTSFSSTVFTNIVHTVLGGVGNSVATMRGVNSGKDWVFVATVLEHNGTTLKAVGCVNGTFDFSATPRPNTTGFDNDRVFIIGRSQGFARYIKGYARNCFVKRGGTTNDVAEIYNRTKAEVD